MDRKVNVPFGAPIRVTAKAGHYPIFFLCGAILHQYILQIPTILSGAGKGTRWREVPVSVFVASSGPLGTVGIPEVSGLYLPMQPHTDKPVILPELRI